MHVIHNHVIESRRAKACLIRDEDPASLEAPVNIITASGSTDNEVSAASLVLTDGSRPVQRLRSRSRAAGLR